MREMKRRFDYGDGVVRWTLALHNSRVKSCAELLHYITLTVNFHDRLRVT